MAVSYTHLDVYKRQVLELCRNACPCNGQEFSEDGLPRVPAPVCWMPGPQGMILRTYVTQLVMVRAPVDLYGQAGRESLVLLRITINGLWSDNRAEVASTRMGQIEFLTMTMSRMSVGWDVSWPIRADDENVRPDRDVLGQGMIASISQATIPEQILAVHFSNCYDSEVVIEAVSYTHLSHFIMGVTGDMYII